MATMTLLNTSGRNVSIIITCEIVAIGPSCPSVFIFWIGLQQVRVPHHGTVRVTLRLFIHTRRSYLGRAFASRPCLLRQ
jgi:hypothetical protein